MDSPQSVIVRQGLSLNSMGAQFELLLEGGATGGAFDLFVGTLPPGGGPPLHRHKEAEVLYVLEGEIAFRTSSEGEAQLARPGELLFAPSMAPHGFSNPGTVPARVLALMTPAGFAGLFRDTALPADLPAPPPGPPSREVLERMFAMFAKYGMEVLEAPPGS